ncbi:MAG: CehA/McbA family metallohydrolase [Pyrinomonadaceae bacterium]
MQAAKSNELNFVVMTEHPAREIDTANATLKGVHDGALFVGGSELVTREGTRFLIAPGFSGINSEAGEHAKPADLAGAPPTSEVLARAKSEGKLSLLAYPEQTRELNIDAYDGIEIYNLYTNSKKINYALLFFDCVWSYRSYADLLWARFYESPRANLERWDELTAKTDRQIVATAGNDAHANVGVRLQDAANHQIFGIQLDPYARSFQVVRTHVLLNSTRNFNTENLLAALKSGHAFIAFDLLADARGFRFTADDDALKKTMGDEITRGENKNVRLRVVAPLVCRVQLIKNGKVFKEARDVSEQEWTITESGVYRVEVYLDQLPTPPVEKLWIISNPIYVR